MCLLIDPVVSSPTGVAHRGFFPSLHQPIDSTTASSQAHVECHRFLDCCMHGHWFASHPYSHPAPLFGRTSARLHTEVPSPPSTLRPTQEAASSVPAPSLDGTTAAVVETPPPLPPLHRSGRSHRRRRSTSSSRRRESSPDRFSAPSPPPRRHRGSLPLLPCTSSSSSSSQPPRSPPSSPPLAPPPLRLPDGVVEVILDFLPVVRAVSMLVRSRAPGRSLSCSRYALSRLDRVVTGLAEAEESFHRCQASRIYF